ncbi:isoprenylcysteine carboxylmethyltransferase family protein [Paraflavitalea speifideaquila]|uniref:methyltransferase family protein n=1 Tax=Paraflavitalea speifideaquila TaxID=3076558 RepID=UPI0028EE7F44|nr:isoprenylcysteine carboxylmethyltransferase family protein [Paraflavitalea speifideiaquila]
MTDKASNGNSSLFLRNLLFTILQPGMVSGLIPWLIAKDHYQLALSSVLSFDQYIGILVFIAGIIITIHCIVRFALDGRGTLSPADPTKQLVISGLYRYSRNPMYIGVMSILIGESLFVQSRSLWLYTLLIFIAFNVFIIFWEERRLRKDFGKSYEDYCRKVRRWI